MEFKTLDGLLVAVEELLPTMTSLEVQSEVKSFQPKMTKLYPGEKIETVRNIIEKALIENIHFGEVDSYHLRSYHSNSTSYYIQLSTKATRDFARDMSRGVFGSLD